MKLGLEVELFGTRKGEVVICGFEGIAADEYPILAEARGLPFNDSFQAVFSVKAEIEKIKENMLRLGIKPLFSNWIEKTNEVKQLNREILRRGIDKRISYENLYGLDVSDKNETHVSAGMHISFTNPYSFNVNGVVKEYNALFDFVKLFRKIETEFTKEIKESERTPGFYELKGDGRIEYRSLPATLINTRDFANRLHKCLGF